jgi:hypothetical protein
LFLIILGVQVYFALPYSGYYTKALTNHTIYVK